MDSQMIEITFICILVSQQNSFLGILSQQLDWASKNASVGDGVVEGKMHVRCWNWVRVLPQTRVYLFSCPFLPPLPGLPMGDSDWHLSKTRAKTRVEKSGFPSSYGCQQQRG